jgi:hypothetical protein
MNRYRDLQLIMKFNIYDPPGYPASALPDIVNLNLQHKILLML